MKILKNCLLFSLLALVSGIGCSKPDDKKINVEICDYSIRRASVESAVAVLGLSYEEAEKKHPASNFTTRGVVRVGDFEWEKQPSGQYSSHGDGVSRTTVDVEGVEAVESFTDG